MVPVGLVELREEVRVAVVGIVGQAVVVHAVEHHVDHVRLQLVGDVPLFVLQKADRKQRVQGLGGNLV